MQAIATLTRPRYQRCWKFNRVSRLKALILDIGELYGKRKCLLCNRKTKIVYCQNVVKTGKR